MTLVVASFFWIDEARGRNRSVVPTPEDVRIWDAMVGRNLTVPHRRVCVTHRPDLIDFMETIPLDMAKHVPGTCLVKLQAHDPKFGEKLKASRILLMDIDCVITGDLFPLTFDKLGQSLDMKFWKNPNYEQGGRRGFYQGSMQLFTPGKTAFLWEDFDPRSTMSWLNRRFGGAEQCWISERLNTSYPEAGWEWTAPYWTEADGVYGAGRLFDGKMGAGVQSELPDNARIVFFPGNRSPSQPSVRARHPWIERFPDYRVGTLEQEAESVKRQHAAWLRGSLDHRRYAVLARRSPTGESLRDLAGDLPLIQALEQERVMLALSTRLWGALLNHATGMCDTVGDVRRLNDAELMRIPNFGGVSLEELRKIIGQEPTV